MRIAFVASFPPRECGIASFTRNLVQSVEINLPPEKGRGKTATVIALNDPNTSYPYPPEVEYVIRQNHREDYAKAAEYIHQSGADICVLQHEFGIFGGEGGVYILSLVNKLKIPFIVTFHTVLKSPTYVQKSILREIASRAAGVVVMCQKAVAFLENIYHIPEEKIRLIPHGVPVPDEDLSPADNILAPYKGRKILFTFGLLNRNKGIETVIRALKNVVSDHPEVVYLVMGNTHPGVLRNEGEEYRESLRQLVSSAGLEDHVHFINRFVTEKDLAFYLAHVDIYITPYLNEAQITSGTLSYAVGAGAAVISTPYWHAQDILSEGRGLLFDFKDHEQLAARINMLLDNPVLANRYRKNALAYGRKTQWPLMGKKYVNMLREVLDEHMLSPVHGRELSLNLPTLPPVDFSHIFRLTDHIGIIQHAKYGIPNLKEGYCLDDNARALRFAVMAYHRFKDREILKLLPVYLSFVHYMQREDGRFRNFLNFRHEFTEEVGSEDAFGRTVQAIGSLIHHAPNSAYREAALDIFHRAAPHFSSLHHLRGIASTLIGIAHYLSFFPADGPFLRLLSALAGKLADAYRRHSSDDWYWYEDNMTYDNGILPLSLLHAYKVTGEETLKEIALENLHFLEKVCFRNGWFTPVGNHGWYARDRAFPLFDQQAIETMAMVSLYHKAYETTNKASWLHKMYRCYAWFLGENELHIPLFDQETGGCCDGLEKTGVNRNQGAESTLAYWISHLTVMRILETGPDSHTQLYGSPQAMTI